MKGRPINPGRGTVEHELLGNGYYFDDKVSFNTQCSTQWDGFAHVPYQHYPEKGKYTYHGGLTSDEIFGGCTKYGIHSESQRASCGAELHPLKAALTQTSPSTP